MIDYIWLVPLLPVIGVVLNGFLGPKLGRSFVSFVGCAVVLAAFGVSLLVWRELAAMAPEARMVDRTIYDWIHTEFINIPVAFRVDPLSVTMILVVTGVGFLIHVYSTGYMWDDARFARYFTYLNLFTFSMLILVLANNYLLMFVGWEGVGLCSYLLIGYYFDRWSAANAGKKAFIVNRVGDFGFLLGLFLIFWYCGGTLTFGTEGGDGVFQRIGRVDPMIVGWIAALLLLGATGKSAQLPLYLWLPDAMEGPTPVSALIHAATMVTAGVYMIARSHAIYALAPQVMTVVAAIGAATALFAALVALVQNDIKRVLAYSTVSQLGYMFLGVGVGAYAAGVFHLVTHAFFKALMFLGAGSVMHSLAGQLDMRKMGGLNKHMPITAGTFLVGWLAICGIPPFAGFYSKDAILASASGGNLSPLFLVGLVTACLTAFYMSRMYFTTFWGPERIELGDEHHGGHDADEHAHEHAHDNGHAHDHAHDHGHGHAHPAHSHVHDDGSVHVHESPPSMTLPLIVLAVGSLLVGLVLNGFSHGGMPQETTTLGTWLEPAVGAAAEHAAHGPLGEGILIALSVAAGLLGIGVAYGFHKQGLFYRGQRGPIGEVLAARFGYDGLLYAIFVKGGSAVAQALWAFVDVVIIDGIVNGVGYLIAQISGALRLLQTGYVRSYALMMLLGAVIVIGWYLTRLG